MSTKKKATAKKAVKKASSAKKAKAPIREFAKAVSKAVEKAVKKSAKRTADKPSLEEILNEAERAFTGVVRRYLELGVAYVKATTYYGSAGRKAFLVRFPLTDNALRNLELVGRGKLLPQFAMCSNRFTTGLANMVDSLMWQQKLLGISKGGTVRVKVGDKIVDKRWDEFIKNADIDGVLSILSEADKDMSEEELAEKLLKLKKTVRSKFVHTKKPAYLVTKNEVGTFVRFYKAKAYTAADLRRIADEIDAAAAAE